MCHNKRRGRYNILENLRSRPFGSRTENIPTTYAKEDKKFKSSYHPCGHVRFHNIGAILD